MSYKKDLKPYVKGELNFVTALVAFIRISGFRAIILFRMSNRNYTRGNYIRAAMLTRLIRFTCNIDIEATAQIGCGTRMPHPFSIIIGGNAKIGDNCTIMQCVTIGGNQGKIKDGITQPQIGDGVFLGPGAKLLGPVMIGDNAKIGANSVVIKDVPPGALAVGVPAIIKQRVGR
ncbi:serine O-acetyltransferase [Pseudomonas canadensis]|uniref:serine O-acetyltransferase n=1 Tax=Pseudomonas canadensis TaxID=915099 RepID=UPI0030D2CCD5